jgi:hypothetical protein
MAHDKMLDRRGYILTIYQNVIFVTNFLMLLGCLAKDILLGTPA